MPWPTTSSRVVYENRWISVTEDAVLMPDGSPGIYGVVTMRHAAVFVVAVTDDDEVLFVRLDRHTVGESLEVPAGGTDGEDVLIAARRELREETGYEAAHVRVIGEMTALNGISRAPEVVVLATGLTPSRLSAADAQRHEGISAVEAVPVARAVELVRSGAITDGETIAALFFAFAELGRIR